MKTNDSSLDINSQDLKVLNYSSLKVHSVSRKWCSNSAQWFFFSTSLYLPSPNSKQRYQNNPLLSMTSVARPSHKIQLLLRHAVSYFQKTITSITPSLVAASTNGNSRQLNLIQIEFHVPSALDPDRSGAFYSMAHDLAPVLPATHLNAHKLVMALMWLQCG
jgi:hypothetical protein